MNKEFNLEILTPQVSFYIGKITLLNLEISEGRIGIMADHIPLVSVIKTSTFSIVEKATIKRGVIIGGILYMSGKEATVVAPRVKWIGDIDTVFIKKRLEQHQKSLENEDLKPLQKEALIKKITYYQVQIAAKETIDNV
ncbi:MAG: hypothetical protein GQ557_02020 [Mycoplasmataceae bacterium]|nr:hypothetical protein [Mycoplasmataceae bacterium]